MSGTPLVSICIPTYNNATMLMEAISSALAQTYSEIEVVVSDNASTDDTEQMVMAIKDTRLRYVRNSTNIGMVGNFRRVLNESRGRYICFLSSDDLLDPEFAQWAVSVLEKNPKAVFAFTAIRFIGARAGQKKIWPFSTLMDGQEFILTSMTYAQNLTYLCGTMISRQAVIRTGLEDLIFFDWTLWLRLASSGIVLYNPKILASYRTHADNETKLKMKRYSQHSSQLMQSVLTYVQLEQPENHIRQEAKRCIDTLFERYADQLGRDVNLSWPDFMADLQMFWSIPVNRPTKIKRTTRAIALRFREQARSFIHS